MQPVKIIAPIHSNLTIADASWAMDKSFRSAVDDRLQELGGSMGDHWPGLRLLYVDFWALDCAAMNWEDFRWREKKGELQLNSQVNSLQLSTLKATTQALAIEIGVLQAEAVAAERYKLPSQVFWSRLRAGLNEAGVDDPSKLGLPSADDVDSIIESLKTKRVRTSKKSTTLAITFKIANEEGDVAIKERHRIEDLLGEALKLARAGTVEGGSIGSGTMEVFATVTNARKARDAIEHALEKARVRDFVITEESE